MRHIFMVFLLTTFAQLSAQPQRPTCISKSELEALIPLDYMYQQHQASLNDQWSSLAKRLSSDQQRRGTKFTIPVVFHVVHENGIENIPDAQVIRALDFLNSAFANTGYYDQQVGFDTEIQFCLAKSDAFNKPTSGINRINSNLTTMVIQSDDIALKDLSRWNPLEYINIWIVKEIISASSGPGVAGYAFFPSAHGKNYDGIVIEARHTGVDESYGAILVHEMGHYLGLYHTFQGGCQNDDCTQDGDMICDTPPDQSTAYAPCSVGMNTCHTDINSGFLNDENDNIENYMDYSDVTCYNQFTFFQKERMQFNIQQARSSLLDSRGCSDPCPLQIHVDFNFPITVSICDSIQLINNSINGDLYYWFIDGLFYSSDFQPKVSVSSIGSYELKLKAYSQDSSCLEVYSIPFDAVCPVQAEITTPLPPCIATVDSVITLVPFDTTAYSFSWFVNGVLESINKDFAYSYSAGVHEVKLVAHSGKCADSAFVNVIVGCVEICGNEVDDDGDGLVDCFDDDCCADCLQFYYKPCAPEECLPLGTSIDIKEKWTLQQSNKYENLNLTCGDIDGDGDVELICRDGANGKGFLIVSKDGVIENQFPWQSTTSPILSRFMHAIADVDRDGTGEILFMSSTDGLVRMEHDGTISFVSDPLKFYQKSNFSFGSISIADLNFDKIPEAIIEHNIVNTLTGDVLFSPDSTLEINIARGRYILADILPDNACPNCQGLEIISGTHIYAPAYDNKSVSLEITFAEYTPTATAIADWDLDGDEDIIATSMRHGQQILTVWEGQTPRILHEIAMSRFSPSGLTVGNFDLDPEPELVFTEAEKEYGVNAHVVLRDNDLSFVWEQPESNISFNSVGGFDFDADGVLEVFYRAQDFLRICHGMNGDVLSEMPCYSFTNDERVLLADFDGDGHTEIATTCENSIMTYEGVVEWSHTRPVHNQYYFYNTHVNDDLTIPAYYQKRSLLGPDGSFNTSMCHYRIKTIFKNEFSIESLRIYCDNGRPNLIINQCQYQNLQQDSVYVSIYSGHPTRGNTIRDTTYKIFISSNNVGCHIDTLALSQQLVLSDSVYVIINDNGKVSLPFNPLNTFPITTLLECDYSDNLLGIPVSTGHSLGDVLQDTTICYNGITDVEILDQWSAYRWSNGGIHHSTTFTTAGQHWIEVTDSCGIKSRDSFYIHQLSSPILNLPDTIITCDFSVTELDAGSHFASYRWSDGAFDQKTTVFNPGWYWVEVVDSCGVIHSDTTVIVTTPIADLNLFDTINLCRGDTFQLSIPSFQQITWQPNGNISCTDCTQPLIFPDTSDFYYVFVYNDEGCSSVDSVYFNLVDKIEFPDTLTLCYADSTFYRGEWYGLGNHSVLVSSLLGCDTSIALVVQSVTSSDFNISIQPEDCDSTNGYFIELLSAGSVTGILTNGTGSQTGTIFNNISAGAYDFQVLNQHNCLFDTSFVLDPIIEAIYSFPDNIHITLGDTAFAVLAGDTALVTSSIWAPDNTLVCSDCPSLIAIPETSQSYFTTITDINGCIHELNVFVHVSKPNQIFTPNVFSPNNDGVNDQFTVYGQNIKQINTLSIFNRWGGKVFSRQNIPYHSTQGWDGTVDGNSAAVGVYVYYYEIEMVNGQILVSKGNVTVVR